MSTVDLVPPDRSRCQAEIPNKRTFMSFGGRPGYNRCENKPEWIATEKEPGEDGLIGSMSLCTPCKHIMEAQLGSDYATFEAIDVI